MNQKNGRKALYAKFLGRAERLLGNDCHVNPFPLSSDLWEAFREGWSRDLNEPLSRDLRGKTSSGTKLRKGGETREAEQA